MSDVVAVTRAELFKLVRRPAAWTLLGAAVLLSMVFGYLIPYLSFRSGSSGPMAGASKEAIFASVLPDQLVGNALGGFPVFAGALALVFGALLFGGEYGWGTVKTVLTAGPGRGAVVAGRGIAMVLGVATAVVVLMGLGAAVSTAIASGEGQSVAFPSALDLLAGFGAGTLILLMWASLGALLGTALRGVALPIGLGVVWALGVENLIAAVAGTMLTALKPLRDVLPGVNSGSLASAVIPARPRGVDAPPGINTDVADVRALITVCCIIALSAVIAWWVAQRRDVA